MNSKSKKRFAAWAKKLNDQYEQKRINYIIEKGFPMKAGRSILSQKIKP